MPFLGLQLSALLVFPLQQMPRISNKEGRGSEGQPSHLLELAEEETW